MRKNVHIKPGKAQSVMGLIVGALFCLLGVFMAIPAFGGFGVIWTLVAVAITVFNGINAFSEEGVSSHEIVIDTDGEDLTPPVSASPAASTKQRLETLKQLYTDGAITNSEYEERRKKILDEI